MRVAIIAPTPELKHCTLHRDTRFHLVLSHLLDDQAYHDYYKECSQRGHYLLLDNGAHENAHGEPIETLMHKAMLLGAHEVAMPDVLEDAERTAERTLEALAWIADNRHLYEEAGCPRLMVIPQGSELLEWQLCLSLIVQGVERSGGFLKAPPVVGISKDYDHWEGGIEHLVESVAPLHGNGWDVHMLGVPRRVRAVRNIAERYPWVRSTDSAKPYVYALEGLLMFDSPTPQYPGRPKKFFSFEYPRPERKLALLNALNFKRAAIGVNPHVPVR